MRIKNLFLLPVALLFSASLFAGEIWVAPNGDDRWAGTREQPKASLHAALRMAREWRRLQDPAVQGGITIYLRGGLYFLNETVLVRPEDSGTPEAPTTIKAAPGEEPILSGGIRVTHWQKLSGKISRFPSVTRNRLWAAKVSVPGQPGFPFRQLWVNNRKAVRAKNRNGLEMDRIIAWNHQTETCVIPAKGLPDLSQANSLEMVIHQWWAIANLRVKKIERMGDSARLYFHQPESRIQSEHPWPAPWQSKETGNSAFFLVNAPEFLDEPGEWYHDAASGMLYYWPREGEDMNSAEAIVPWLENLLRISGTVDHPVTDFYVHGLQFSHAAWQRPGAMGHVPLQAGMYILDAYKLKKPGTPDKAGLENQAWVGRPRAAAEAEYTARTAFIGCRFKHLASTGIDYKKANFGDTIAGCLFKDIGGSAVLAGTFSDEAVEAHLPYNPSDEREITRGMLITNNLINDCTNEDWGTVGIGAGFVQDMTISHNDISELSYSGISLGWGWTKTINALKNNRVLENRIERYGRHMYDVAAIYTLSAQPGTVISRNFIGDIYKARYAHLPEHWFYLYTDEGSSYMTVKDNRCPAPRFLKNANGPGNTWLNNGPLVHDSLVRNAGLQPEWAHLLKDKMLAQDIPVNAHTWTMILVQTENPDAMDLDSLHRTAVAVAEAPVEIHRWENQIVLYAPFPDTEMAATELGKVFPSVQVKTFATPFYTFDRERCHDLAKVRPWKNILLSVNLSADPKLRNEYLELHRDQFKLYPEVIVGFCRADFQQLQIFRNERQLLLVISIPSGADFEALNKKTADNNPRVDEWNQRTGKLVEGLPGTRPGETWVFLNQIK